MVLCNVKKKKKKKTTDGSTENEKKKKETETLSKSKEKSKLESELSCMICSDLIVHPITLYCCKQVLCHECIICWLWEHESCPHCRKILSKIAIVHAEINKDMQDKVNQYVRDLCAKGGVLETLAYEKRRAESSDYITASQLQITIDRQEGTQRINEHSTTFARLLPSAFIIIDLSTSNNERQIPHGQVTFFIVYLFFFCFVFTFGYPYIIFDVCNFVGLQPNQTHNNNKNNAYMY
ncbi:hypothetical protein RFI_18904, partial [Reticulomyxa filosa]